MKNLYTKLKAVIRNKPASISAIVSLVLTNAVTLGVLDISPEKSAAIVGLVTAVTMAVANLLAPTKPDTGEQLVQGGGE